MTFLSLTLVSERELRHLVRPFLGLVALRRDEDKKKKGKKRQKRGLIKGFEVSSNVATNGGTKKPSLNRRREEASKKKEEKPPYPDETSGVAEDAARNVDERRKGIVADSSPSERFASRMRQ